MTGRQKRDWLLKGFLWGIGAVALTYRFYGDAALTALVVFPLCSLHFGSYYDAKFGQEGPGCLANAVAGTVYYYYTVIAFLTATFFTIRTFPGLTGDAPSTKPLLLDYMGFLWMALMLGTYFGFLLVPLAMITLRASVGKKPPPETQSDSCPD